MSVGSIPRKDYALLPLVALFSAIALIGLAELSGRLLLPERGKFSCSATVDGIHREASNCVSDYKNREGPMVEYRFNECGYRSTAPCGPKPSGTLRLALIGTSVTMGLYVPQEETFGARVQKSLSSMCSTPVEVENLGSLTTLAEQPAQAGEALHLVPDAVVLTVIPYDLENGLVNPDSAVTAAAPADPPAGVGAFVSQRIAALETTARGSSAVYLFENLMLRDDQVVYQQYLNGGSSHDLAAVPSPPSGARLYSRFGDLLNGVQAGLHHAVPLLVLILPNRSWSAIASNHLSMKGVDPAFFGRHVGEIARAHGASSVDSTPEFFARAHSERFFYPIDNHPTGQAHELLAEALTKKLTDGSVAGWNACAVAGLGKH